MVGTLEMNWMILICPCKNCLNKYSFDYHINIGWLSASWSFLFLCNETLKGFLEHYLTARQLIKFY